MSSIDSLHILFLATGFTVGFGHCIGMCGPIVVSLSLNLQGRKVMASHLFYNLGRVSTYALLGGIMGITGSFTRVTGSIANLQKGVMIFAGGIIILMGIAMLGWIPLGRIFGDYYNPKGIISRGFRRLTGSGVPLSHYPLGLLLGLLPCGPVYTALIAAARGGMEAPDALAGFLNGFGLMLAFGLGTVPALLIVARLADLGWLKWRKIVYRVGALLMIAVGIYFVVKGIAY